MNIIRITGDYEILGNIKHFVPFALPPKNPTLQMDQQVIEYYGEALHELGKLNEMIRRIPNKEKFLRGYIIKEALLSSKIENIHTTLIEVFSAIEGIDVPNKETQLVLNYSLSLSHALDLMKEQGLPLTSKVICEAHAVLLSEGSDHAAPGKYRKQQVRVGDLIPPQSTLIPELMSDLEKFINMDSSILPLIKAGLVHVQFETIHPFLDGNGRIGRQLIILMLIENGLLSEPILYPSYYFKKHHAEYYARLDAVRISGDFESWIKFYLKAVSESAKDATKRAEKIEELEQNIKKQIIVSGKFGKNIALAIEYLETLFQTPMINIPESSKSQNKSPNTIRKIVKTFVELGILEPITTKKRNQKFAFSQYLEILEENYE